MCELELYHHGIKGQKWGIRRYQNKDGSLTPAGKKRAQQDADELKKAVGKTFDTYDAYRNLTLRINTLMSWINWKMLCGNGMIP